MKAAQRGEGLGRLKMVNETRGRRECTAFRPLRTQGEWMRLAAGAAGGALGKPIRWTVGRQRLPTQTT